jgi:hypothetical protein
MDLDTIQSRMEHFVFDANFFARHKLQKQIKQEEQKEKLTFYYPKMQDSLFWCFFCMQHSQGKDLFDFDPHIVHREKQLKIDFIPRLREKKEEIKTFKFDTLANIENQLANERSIDVSGFLALCVSYNLNICFIRKNVFSCLRTNPSSDQIFFVKWNATNRFGFKEGLFSCLSEETGTLFEIEDILKPVKALSYYLLPDLVKYCENIGLSCVTDANKKKTKAELHQMLIEYFA